MSWTDRDVRFMHRALELAARGRGWVEPNPLVGCVIAQGESVLAEGFHAQFGGPHAEIVALRTAAAAARGAELFVTLEPCCHFGKTPPCTDAILAAGIRRVVVATADPFPAVAGQGLERLRQAGLDVTEGLLRDEAQTLNAPFWMLVTHGRPWVLAKWAMSLDGKISSRSGDSRWISNEACRAEAHRLRGRVDAILVGRRTVEHDDPLLTARPRGPRTPTRIVLDSQASLASDAQLLRTLDQAPVLVVVADTSADAQRQRLADAGGEVFIASGATWDERLPVLLKELGRRRMTNLLVEGGSATLTGFGEAGLIDEVHVFIAPKLIGGQDAPNPLGGRGAAAIREARQLTDVRIVELAGNVYLSGRVTR